ncbi:hypothetical protein F9C28_08610 [Shimwellia pseudoproteus]|uniref:glycerol dehydratase reactivase beta/small subunit family protein n=1 Tax=Shimwellia pseudoproteus TaxID=570012 RepID=UPI0018ED9E28|nr:glycerol dehydratase reactivase beta/small subunit family protein [Shimwellia pseudoproteus]MBJ3814984.1 hypothetical protein [Shimwellia pseudoproteus]
MQNPGVPASPAVHLFYPPQLADSEILRQLCLGLEEQGVPCRRSPQENATGALHLARLAAQSSALRVGLGVAANGDVALTHAQYPADRALRVCPAASTPAQLRNLGANAGQLVKVIPFSECQ